MFKRRRYSLPKNLEVAAESCQVTGDRCTMLGYRHFKTWEMEDGAEGSGRLDKGKYRKFRKWSWV